MEKENLPKKGPQVQREVPRMTVTVAVRIPDVMFDRLCVLKEKEYFKPLSLILREAIADHLNKKGV